jgi:hypothetical protein
MAAFDYARAKATASRLIARYGMAAAIRRVISGSPVTHSCKLVVMNYDDRKIDGTLIKATDKLLYVSTEGLNIKLNQSDKIIIDGLEYAVVTCKPLSPAGMILYWEVQARR